MHIYKILRWPLFKNQLRERHWTVGSALNQFFIFQDITQPKQVLTRTGLKDVRLIDRGHCRLEEKSASERGSLLPLDLPWQESPSVVTRVIGINSGHSDKQQCLERQRRHRLSSLLGMLSSQDVDIQSIFDLALRTGHHQSDLANRAYSILPFRQPLLLSKLGCSHFSG